MSLGLLLLQGLRQELVAGLGLISCCCDSRCLLLELSCHIQQVDLFLLKSVDVLLGLSMLLRKLLLKLEPLFTQGKALPLEMLDCGLKISDLLCLCLLDLLAESVLPIAGVPYGGEDPMEGTLGLLMCETLLCKALPSVAGSAGHALLRSTGWNAGPRLGFGLACRRGLGEPTTSLFGSARALRS